MNSEKWGTFSVELPWPLCRSIFPRRWVVVLPKNIALLQLRFAHEVSAVDANRGSRGVLKNAVGIDLWSARPLFIDCREWLTMGFCPYWFRVCACCHTFSDYRSFSDVRQVPCSGLMEDGIEDGRESKQPYKKHRKASKGLNRSTSSPFWACRILARYLTHDACIQPYSMY